MITVDIPASKSLTHRAMIAASLAYQKSELINPLDCEDTRHTRSCLEKFGVHFTRAENGNLHITGLQALPPRPPAIFAGDSGTSARLLAAVSAALGGATLDGSPQMRRRPLDDLAKALKPLGVIFHWEKTAGYLPCTIQSSGLFGGKTAVSLQKSSQFLSGLLLAAPLAKETLTILLDTETPVSWPYVELTLEVMEQFGIKVAIQPAGANIPRLITIHPQTYQSCRYKIENDWSSAAFFCVAAAIGKIPLCLRGLSPASRQGDSMILPLLKRMGAKIETSPTAISIFPSALVGIEADMQDTPDLVPALAVAAACANTKSRFKNINHLRLKESDRIESVAAGLRALGVTVFTEKNSLEIHPCRNLKKQPESILTQNDHRIAMSMSLFELKGCVINLDNPACVNKSFPHFWQEWEKVRQDENR